MNRHPSVPHVLYETAIMPSGAVRIGCVCQACGEPFQWKCTSGPDMIRYRIDSFAALHAHGLPYRGSPHPRRLR